VEVCQKEATAKALLVELGFRVLNPKLPRPCSGP